MPVLKSLTCRLIQIVALTVVAGQAFADNAPPSLRGKSVVISWTENRLQRSGLDNDFRPRSVAQVMQVYISTEGRTFERRSAMRNGKSGSAEGIGGGAIAATGATRFRGTSLVMAGAMKQGARLINVEFDQGFSSCTAKVVVGHEAGSEIMRGRSLINKKPIEFKTLGTSGERCAVQNGNVFAQ
jgi:hypothetical protein